MDELDSLKDTSFKSVIRISQGPQLNSENGPVWFVISLACLISAIFCTFTLNFIAVPFLIIPTIVFINIALDIHGIEINRDNQTIREYRSILWWKIGKFRKISDYTSIQLLQENVVIRTTEYSDHRSDTYHYYRIYMVDEANNKEIFLAENKNFYKAERLAQQIASYTGMTYKNLLKKGIKKVTVI
jgi:hypothetical protein